MMLKYMKEVWTNALEFEEKCNALRRLMPNLTPDKVKIAEAVDSLLYGLIEKDRELRDLRARIDGAQSVTVTQNEHAYIMEFDPADNKGKWIHRTGTFQDMQPGETRTFKLVPVEPSTSRSRGRDDRTHLQQPQIPGPGRSSSILDLPGMGARNRLGNNQSCKGSDTR